MKHREENVPLFPITILYHACQQYIMNNVPISASIKRKFIFARKNLRKKNFPPYFLLIFSKEQATIEPDQLRRKYYGRLWRGNYQHHR